MADPRAFVSFDFDHNEDQKRYFVGQAQNSRTPFNIQDWSSKEELAQSRWEEIIKDKINRCNLMFVLVGKQTWNAIGVKKEIKMAQSQKVPFVGVYVDGADSSTLLPEGLPRNRTIAWKWDAVADAINQMMKEGKNL